VLSIELKSTKDKIVTDNYVFVNAVNPLFSTAGFIYNQNVLLHEFKGPDIFLPLRINEVFSSLIYEFISLGLDILTKKAEFIKYRLKNKVDSFIVSIEDYKLLTKGCIEMINNEILMKRLIKNSITKVEQILKDVDSTQISKLIRDLK
tara:strand:+ start:1535 stop:1978 length:444 start_codon:yes stop_codon:yes gene_type:complete